MSLSECFEPLSVFRPLEMGLYGWLMVFDCDFEPLRFGPVPLWNGNDALAPSMTLPSL